MGRVRDKNEDAFVIAELTGAAPIHEVDGAAAAMPEPMAFEVGSRGVLLAVSDGMGGARSGEVASALTLHALRKGLSTVAAPSADEALVACVERANQRVFQEAKRSGRNGMGATITAVLVFGDRAYVAEVGDSRAYVLRGRHLVQLTHDQSAMQLLLDENALTREQAETFRYRNVILQAIGVKPSVEVALNRLSLRRGDRLLLCSDGLWGKVDERTMQTIVASAPSLDVACTKLVDMANERGGQDNITVVLAELGGEGLPAFQESERVNLETVQEFHAKT